METCAITVHYATSFAGIALTAERDYVESAVRASVYQRDVVVWYYAFGAAAQIAHLGHSPGGLDKAVRAFLADGVVFATAICPTFFPFGLSYAFMALPTAPLFAVSFGAVFTAFGAADSIPCGYFNLV